MNASQRVLVDRVIASIKSQVAGLDSGFGSEEKLEALLEIRDVCAVLAEAVRAEAMKR